MDPFTALGVAASALQFFDFSRSLLKEYQKQTDRAEYLTRESFQKATEDLVSCMERMEHAASTRAKNETGEWTQHEEVGSGRPAFF